MSKKGYEALAAEFAALKPEYPCPKYVYEPCEEMRVNLARRVASVLEADNPNFDRARFLKAAEVEE